MNPIIPIIIPTYEPDERFEVLLSDLKKASISPIIIVDDGSSAEYRHYFDAAENQYGAIVLRHEINYGKGRGLKTAFSYCLENYPDMVGCVTADSDGQHTPMAITQCKTALYENPEKLVLGVRCFDGDDVPAKSQFGNNLTRKVFKMLYKVDITDTQTGLRGISRKYMQELLAVDGDRFEYETRMLIDAVQKDITIMEVPIETIYDSKENHSTHFRPIADSIRIYSVFKFAFGAFLLSSLSSSVIDLVLFQILCLVLKNGFSSIGYVAVASVLARIVSAVYNYLVNYVFVFNSKRKHQQAAVRYFVLAIAQMICSATLTTGLVGLIKVHAEFLVKVPVDVILFFISYKIQKKYVY